MIWVLGLEFEFFGIGLGVYSLGFKVRVLDLGFVV
jgi:hypothetical protein